MPPPARPVAVVLFDGDCAFCRHTVAFLRCRDARGALHFCGLKSPEGRTLLIKHGLPPDRLDSIVLIEGDKFALRSTAILRIFLRLRGAWPLLYAGILLPRKLRDRLYDAVARRRNG